MKKTAEFCGKLRKMRGDYLNFGSLIISSLISFHRKVRKDLRNVASPKISTIPTSFIGGRKGFFIIKLSYYQIIKFLTFVLKCPDLFYRGSAEFKYMLKWFFILSS